MTADMLNGDNLTVGNVTSGGTESILMAMKAYRDRARALWPHITHPEMVSKDWCKTNIQHRSSVSQHCAPIGWCKFYTWIG